MSEEEYQQYLRMFESLSEHDKMVKVIEEDIRYLGLLLWKRSGSFFEGFRPDIVTNVGGTKKDWVLVEVINTSESLLRDISGLLVVKANIEKHGHSVRGIIEVLSDKVENVKPYVSLYKQYSNFYLTRPMEIQAFLQTLILESAEEKLKESRES